MSTKKLEDMMAGIEIDKEGFAETDFEKETFYTLDGKELPNGKDE